MNLLVSMIVNFPQQSLPKELAALAINLSLTNRNAEAMVQNRALNHMMDRLATTRDPLLLKIIRNISLWTYHIQTEPDGDVQYRYRGLWSPHITGNDNTTTITVYNSMKSNPINILFIFIHYIILVLLQVLYEADDHEILIEAFGTLANLTTLDLPQNQSWSKLLSNDDFFGLISRMLVPGICQNDVLLEVILVLQAISYDSKALDVMEKTNIISLLYQIWQEKSDGCIELCLQMIYLFHLLLVHPGCREEVMYSTRVVVDIIDKLNHANRAIRETASKATELILELDRKEDGKYYLIINYLLSLSLSCIIIL
jgi:hypothetical protein